jgi:Lhr-like helicase
VAAWFGAPFAAATGAQLRAWPLISAGRATLVVAPTGSGKTLTVFLAAIDAPVREISEAPLPYTAQVLYVSPLKALSNDIRRNLQAPLEGIGRQLAAMGLPAHGIRTAVRTGDTTTPERNAMRKRPPHILVTTPESLYVLPGSTSGRAMLSNVRTVIVDEIHAVAGSKRGSHLALSLERLDTLCARKPVRVGVSATQKPLSKVAQFLVAAVATAVASAPWSTSATCARATSGSRCRRCRSKRSCPTRCGSGSTTAWPNWRYCTAARSFSSLRGAWPSGSRVIQASVSAPDTSRPTMAAWPGNTGWPPNDA